MIISGAFVRVYVHVCELPCVCIPKHPWRMRQLLQPRFYLVLKQACGARSRLESACTHAESVTLDHSMLLQRFDWYTYMHACMRTCTMQMLSDFVQYIYIYIYIYIIRTYTHT